MKTLDLFLSRLAAVCGDCFEAAGRLAQKIEEKFPAVQLVHAEVTGTTGESEGKRFIHAWVEAGGNVYDFANNQSIIMPKEDYYAAANVGNIQRYSVEELLINMLRHKHWGPW